MTRAKEHRKVNTSVGLSHTSGLWFNHVDAQAIATFQQRTVLIVNYQTGYANKIPPLPEPAVSNLNLDEIELPAPAERIVLLFRNAHYFSGSRAAPGESKLL